jgi:hypothetical protein
VGEVTTEFRRADGFIVCDGCGATYSNVLSVCPQCKTGAVEEEGDSTRRFLCIQDEPCPVGGADGVCCLSCDRLQKCKRVCPTAESYGGSQPGEDDVLCEFMEVKIIGRGKEETPQ